MVTETEARSFLRGYKSATAEIRAIELTIGELRSSVIIPAGSSDGMPHARNTETDLSDYAAKLDLLERRLYDKKENAVNSCERILKEIEKLSDKYERAVLRYHYICGMTWDETADLVGYSRTQIIRIQSNAVRQIALNLPGKE